MASYDDSQNATVKTPGGHMSSVYESLKGTLQRSKTNSVGHARIKGNDAARVNHEMDELEKMVADRIVRLRAAVRDGETAVAASAQYTEQVIESLRTEIATLETQLDAARDKEAASQKMEQTLAAKIHDLQSDVKKKEESLDGRGKEINEYNSKIDVLGKQVTQLEETLQQARAQAVEEARRTQKLADGSMAKVALLETQLRDGEETARTKELAFQGLERNLTAKIQDLENQVNNKEKLLLDRDRQIKDLHAQVATLTNGIKGMSSFFKQTEALAAVEVQNVGPVASGQPQDRGGEQAVDSQLEEAEAVVGIADAAPEMLAPDFFDRATRELAEILGPFSAIIVRDHVHSLGESVEKFPRTRVTELINVLSEEITDEKLKLRFRKRLTENA
jgi:peptidoglycan hydrolase CwlO-like protein